MFPAVIVVLLLLQLSHATCPRLLQLPTFYARDVEIRNGTSIAFPAVSFDVTPFTNDTLVVNLTSPLGVFCEPHADTGLQVQANPQGFCGRYLTRLQLEALHSYGIIPQASPLKNYTIQVVILRSQLPSFSIQGDETVSVTLPGGFFGNSSTCNEDIVIGRIVVLSTYSATATNMFLQIVVFLSMVVGGIAGVQSPSPAVDAQTMVMLGSTSCAAPKEAAVLSSFRALSPLAADETIGGMLIGNSAVIIIVWVAWTLTVTAISKVKQKSFSKAAAALYFPSRPFAISMVLFQGMSFTAFRCLFHGILASNTALLAGGAVAAASVILSPVFLLIFVRRDASVPAEFHLYSTVNISSFLQFIYPVGQWGPKNAARKFGSFFTALKRPEKFFMGFVMCSPLAMGFIASFEPSTASGCHGQYIALLCVQLVLSVVPAATQLHRSPLSNFLAVCSCVLLTVTAAVIGVSRLEQVAAVSIEIPVNIFCVVLAVRNIHNVFLSLSEMSERPLAKLLFMWYTPKDQGVSMTFEADDDSLSLDSDESGPTGAPVENALLRLPSVMNKEAAGWKKPDELDDLFDAIDTEAKMKAAKAAPASADPFADEDPFADLPTADSFSGKPSSVKHDSFSRNSALKASVEDPFADPFADIDPFADLGEPARKPDAKLKAAAKKVMLSAALKKVATQASVNREQDEMFGNVAAKKVDYLRPAKRDEPGEDDFVKEMLQAAGVNTDLSKPQQNPMEKAGLSASAFSQNSASAARKTEPKDMLGDLVKKVNVRHLEDDEPEDPRKEYVIVYRVEEERLVKQPRAEFGQFFDGDSYVVVRHRIPAGAEISKDSEYEFFIWIGTASTADEYTAAIERTVEKDEMCPSDMHPVVFTGGFRIHREQQGHETSAFLALFPGQTISVKEGGIDSRGFQPKLFHVHGTSMRNTKMTQVPVSFESLDEDDVFVLDAGQILYVFQGTDCAPMERMAGGRFAQDFATNRVGGRVQVVTSADAPEEFWVLLGITKKKAKGLTLKRDEDLHPSTVNRAFRVKGDNSFELLASGREVSDDLCNSNAVLIFDMCTVVFIWIGKEASGYATARSKAMTHGVQYLKKHSALTVPLVRVIEGHEGSEFDEMFL